MSDLLAIERALEISGEVFSEKYTLMKSRLLNVEYEHWAAGFPYGNNHGRGHITRVLENLDRLVGPAPLTRLDPYELFLAMMSILYHDIGILRQRKGHEDISKKMIDEDANDAYIINTIDREIIAAAVVSHSSSKDIGKECGRFSAEEPIGKHRARPAVIAALVRLADELDEDFRRADPILQQRLNVPDEAKFFWLFCQRVRGVRPNFLAKRIDFNIAFEREDTMRTGPVPGGKVRHFLEFCAEKLAKINQERVIVNRFLPPELQYTGLHIDLKPLPSHPKWTSPRTFVFNDHTTAQMFVDSNPELLAEASNTSMENILHLMKENALDEAEQELNKVLSVTPDLPTGVELSALFERACIYSMRATVLPPKSIERERALDLAVQYVLDWFKKGTDGAFKAVGRTASAELGRMLTDNDLSLVCSERRDVLKREISSDYWPSAGGGGGCVLIGTLIDTPSGPVRVENLRLGDEVISIQLEEKAQRFVTRVAALRTVRTPRCIQISPLCTVTPPQRVLSQRGWIRAQDLRSGDQIMNANGQLQPVTPPTNIFGYFEVFNVTINNAAHNYVANGVLCHNDKR